MILALAAGLLAGPGALPAPAAASEKPPEVTYFWRWSDGSRSAQRSLSEAAYRDAARLPSLIVTAVPAGRPTSVRLAVRRAGRWMTEDVSATGSSGVATLSLNPYCRNGDWCDERQDYRLSIGGRSARLAVTFVPDRRTSWRTRAD